MDLEIPDLPKPQRKAASNISPEEIAENLRCSHEEKAEIKLVLGQGIETAKKYATGLSKELRGTPHGKERCTLERKAFLLTQGAILLPTNKELGENSETHILLNHLGRKNLLRQMDAKQGMALAICSLRCKDPVAFKKIIFNFKTIPKKKDSQDDRANIELLAIPTENGQTLGHLAAKEDIQEAIQYIACNHRNLLELPDKEGNTLIHTASRFHSTETIHYLLGLSKKLFGRKNIAGKTPLDLESGPEICKTIALAIVEQDIKAGEETLKKAVKAIKAIRQKSPKKGETPTPSPVPSPKLKMETLPIP